MDKKAQNKYRNLENQLMGIFRHNRQGSIATKGRYLSSSKRFCKFVAENFGLENFKNIQNKHIQAYIADMRGRELKPAHIKTEISAIRFFHDKCDKTRYQIGTNEELGYTEKRTFGGVERAWSDSEYQKFKEVCSKQKKDVISAVATLARNEGLRIHETFKISRHSVENGLRSNFLHVIGKGGKERDVPLSSESRDLLKNWIEYTPRGEKLFVPSGVKTHLEIKKVQNFINYHREKYQDTDRRGDKIRDCNITFHGLRHAYAREQYEERIAKGLSDYQARLEVSELLGHERDEVTRIYLCRK